DTATARPVALLYGGSPTDTVANPIQDVIGAFGANSPLSVVGGADHVVSCARTATATSTQVGAQAAVVPQERQRVTAVLQRRAAQLGQNPSVQSVSVGASADNAGEGALLVHVSGNTIPRVPPEIDGVRTRLVFDTPAAAQSLPGIGKEKVTQALAVKEANVANLLSQPGIQGVAVSLSLDNPTEAAISIYLLKGAAHNPI